MPASPERVPSPTGVVIAVDPHKASWTAVTVTAALIPAGAVRVEANRAGYRQMRRFAGTLPVSCMMAGGVQDRFTHVAQTLVDSQ